MLKRWLPSLLIVGLATLAHATTLQEFEAQSSEAQGHLVYRFVRDLANKNPSKTQAIMDYFGGPPNARDIPPGMADLVVQILAADRLAKQGKADLSKIQVEAMIVYVVKQHFKG